MYRRNRLISAAGKLDSREGEITVGILLLGLLFAMDIISTEIILLNGGQEMNRFMAFFTEDPLIHGILKTGVLLLVAVAAWYANRFVKFAGTILIFLVITWYAIVVANNLELIVLHVAH